MPIWLQLLNQHFSDPCYNGKPLVPSDMLSELMYCVEHGLQHGDCRVTWDTTVQPAELVIQDFWFHDVTIGSVFYPTWDGCRIPEPDMLQYLGVVPDPGQSGQEYVEEHFSMY